MGYNYNFLCTYHLLNNDDLEHLGYQKQFLQAFDIEFYDISKINNTINKLFNELKDLFDFKLLLSNVDKKIQDDKKINILKIFNEKISDLDLFYFIFSYDYFYIFHNEYSKFKNNKDYNFNFL